MAKVLKRTFVRALVSRACVRSIAAVALALGTAAALPAAAQEFPARPIRIVMGTPAGEAIDVIYRMFAEKMSGPLGQSLFIDNRPGAAGLIGLDTIINSAPDGYTIGLLQSPSLISGLFNGREWKPDQEMTPIGLDYRQGVLLSINPNVPIFKDVKGPADLVRVVRANPGKVNFGTIGPGSTGHLVGELMKTRGLQWEHIAYKGGVPLIQAVAAGSDPIVGIGTSLQDVDKNPGRVVVVATSAGRPQGPYRPLAEAGFPDIDATTWGGMVGPARLPAPVLAKLSAAYKTAFDNPEIQDKAGKILIQEYMAPPEFGQLIRSHIATWSKVIKDNNIHP
jgi:tripartite-type tricarboxylate transporter receptor subunit TctC